MGQVGTAQSHKLGVNGLFSRRYLYSSVGFIGAHNESLESDDAATLTVDATWKTGASPFAPGRRHAPRGRSRRARRRETPRKNNCCGRGVGDIALFDWSDLFSGSR